MSDEQTPEANVIRTVARLPRTGDGWHRLRKARTEGILRPRDQREGDQSLGPAARRASSSGERSLFRGGVPGGAHHFGRIRRLDSGAADRFRRTFTDLGGCTRGSPPCVTKRTVERSFEADIRLSRRHQAGLEIRQVLRIRYSPDRCSEEVRFLLVTDPQCHET